MDYCSSCRRHLNGALVCPGCGAYAPDIAPVAVDARTVRPRPVPSPALPGATWDDTVFEARDEDRSAQTDPSSDLTPVPAAPQGRAARRRQLARWKKNQRRAVVATAVALVGGGLSVVAMERQSGDRTQAAAAPKLPSTASAEEPTSEHTRPVATHPDVHRSSSTSPSQSPATELAREQSVAAAPRTTAQSTRPDAPAAAHTPATSTQQQRTARSSSGGTAADSTGSDSDTGSDNGTGTGTTSQQTSAPAANNGTNSSSTSQTSPSTAATSPSDVCLLGLICLS